ncbi:tyrosine-type recombinase/integrase [Vibrio parahaemolyticus]|uniref:tyrosine-type recombinase/integrase n=1 Tax=Vibrio parahaemolyticus TaxID=670 RepID=UPI00226B8D02|nr:site-specific integrase [Vibrio parahaemolyticus]MCX8817011.1 site-specific integrase [Vibrio parahaemolyticus]
MAAFSDAWLRATSGKPYKGKPEVTYRDGLGVRISPKGKITWIYRFQLNGRPIKMKIGEYPALKIREAERLKDERADLVAQGVDPRKSESLISKQKRPQTIDEIIEYWAVNHARQNIERSDSLESMFATDISPYIGQYKAERLEIVDYMVVFKKARERVSAKHSANLMSRFKSVLSYAVRHGLLQHNVIMPLKKTDVGEPVTPKKSKQDLAGVKAMWKLIDQLTIHHSNCNFLRLMMIFACRGCELRTTEKRDFDLVNEVWIVREENNKTRKKGGGVIARPIPKLALPIIREQMAMYPNFNIMFPPVNKREDRPMSLNVHVNFGNALADLMQRNGYPRTTNHDMRRTARNLWEAMKVDYFVGESMLGHKVHKGVSEHYLDYQYLDEQREAYEKWSDAIMS